MNFKHIFIALIYFLAGNQVWSMQYSKQANGEISEQQMKLQQKLKDAIKINDLEKVKTALIDGAKVNIKSPSAFIEKAIITPFFDSLLLAQFLIDRIELNFAQKAIPILSAFGSVILAGYVTRAKTKTTKAVFLSIPSLTLIGSAVAYYRINKDKKYLEEQLKKSFDSLALIIKQPEFFIDQEAEIFFKKQNPSLWNLVTKKIANLRS